MTSEGFRAESYGFEVLDSSWIKSLAGYSLKPLIGDSVITMKLPQTVGIVAPHGKVSRK